jgi:hypothetical protein
MVQTHLLFDAKGEEEGARAAAKPGQGTRPFQEYAERAAK